MAFKCLPYFFRKQCTNIENVVANVIKTGIKISMKVFDLQISLKNNEREKRLKFCVIDFKFFRIT